MFFLAPRLFKVHLRDLEDSPCRWRGNGSQGRREDTRKHTVSWLHEKHPIRPYHIGKGAVAGQKGLAGCGCEVTGGI